MKVIIITNENGIIETGSIETDTNGFLNCMQELIDGNYSQSTVNIMNGNVIITARS